MNIRLLLDAMMAEASRFIDGSFGDAGYAEIFINPSGREIRSSSSPQGKASPNYVPKFEKLGGVPFYSSAAILTPEDWYLWNREYATHQKIKAQLADLLRGVTSVIPVYAYYLAKSNTLVISIAKFSLGMGERYTVPAIKRVVKSNRHLRQFHVIVDNNLDDFSPESPKTAITYLPSGY